MIKKILVFILWFIVWLLLSWPPERADIITGAIVALMVSLVTADMLTESRRAILKNPMRYLWFVYYVAVFLVECVKANIDVAFRVLHPDLPIRPGTIKVKVTLKSDIGLTFLASSITLTPGTTTVDIDKQKGYIYVHWLCVSKKHDVRSERLAVVEKFEKILKRVFE